MSLKRKKNKTGNSTWTWVVRCPKVSVELAISGPIVVWVTKEGRKEGKRPLKTRSLICVDYLLLSLGSALKCG